MSLLSLVNSRLLALLIAFGLSTRACENIIRAREGIQGGLGLSLSSGRPQQQGRMLEVETRSKIKQCSKGGKQYRIATKWRAPSR